jgi:murein DD-endopeptidase MepM/ murein hydrolase activator NlpD
MIETITQMLGQARQAGFSGDGLITIVAISCAENPAHDTSVISQPNWDGSVDRGILQINSRAWPNITNAQALDAQASFDFAYSLISNKGTNFSPWMTYQSGEYQKYVKQVSAQEASTAPAGTQGTTRTAPWNATDAGTLWPWLLPLTAPHITWFYNSINRGLDIAEPFHTKITSLTSGTVIGVGYPDGIGGVVSVKSYIPFLGGWQSVYYQHLDDNLVSIGQTINVGDVIGLSGGQISGGDHPCSPQFSTGPHITVGVNDWAVAPWNAIGPNVDPLPWLKDLVANGPPASDRVNSTPVIGGITSTLDSLSGGSGTNSSLIASMCVSFDNACEFYEWYPIDLGLNPINAIPSMIGAVLNPGSIKGTNQYHDSIDLGVVILHDLVSSVLRLMLVIFGILLLLVGFWHLLEASGTIEAAQKISNIASQGVGQALSAVA